MVWFSAPFKAQSRHLPLPSSSFITPNPGCLPIHEQDPGSILIGSCLPDSQPARLVRSGNSNVGSGAEEEEEEEGDFSFLPAENNSCSNYTACFFMVSPFPFAVATFFPFFPFSLAGFFALPILDLWHRVFEHFFSLLQLRTLYYWVRDRKSWGRADRRKRGRTLADIRRRHRRRHGENWR